MDTLLFLKGLPAVLGMVGFFAYLWAGQYRIGGDLMKGIVEKLRAAPNVDINNYSSLTPARIGRLIEGDAAVRGAVNEQDIKLIRLIVILHNVITVIVLLVCAGLVGLGIWLVSRPAPLSVVPRPPAAAVGTGPEIMLTDLDSIKVEWDASGATETVNVSLENADTNARTPSKSVLADVRNVTFDADELHDVASTRQYRGKNRIRTVVEWSGHTVRSNATDLLVGIKVQLMIGGTLVTPEESRSINTLVATIDDSTEHMPRDYCFTVDFVGWSHRGPLVAPVKACNMSSEVSLPFLVDVDWNRHIGLVLNQPADDRPIVRLCLSAPERPDRTC